MTYQRLELVPFSKELLRTGDLDPIYLGLHKMKMPIDQLKRWLVSYWCFYHAGAACLASEWKGEQFWDGLETIALNVTPAPTGGRWPRGAERRHWRGKQAFASFSDLRQRYRSPEHMVDYLTCSLDGTTQARHTFAAVAGRAQEHTGFGEWISFKVCDMLERCLGVQIDFDQSAVFMFKDPALAADMAWERYVAPVKNTKLSTLERRERIVKHLCTELAEFAAPPSGDRPVNIQEVETCLCKWKSHINGHYPLNKDTVEIRHGLEEWRGHSKTAAKMFEVM